MGNKFSTWFISTAVFVAAILFFLLSCFNFALRLDSSPSFFGKEIRLVDKLVFGGDTPTLILVDSKSEKLSEGDFFLMDLDGQAVVKTVTSIGEKSFKYSGVPSKSYDFSDGGILLYGSEQYIGKITYRSALLGGAAQSCSQDYVVYFFIFGTAIIILLLIAIVYIYLIKKTPKKTEDEPFQTTKANAEAAALVEPASEKPPSPPPKRDVAADARRIQAQAIPAIRHITINEPVKRKKTPHHSPDTPVAEPLPKPPALQDHIIEVEDVLEDTPSVESLISEINSFLPADDDEWDEDLKIYSKK